LDLPPNVFLDRLTGYQDRRTASARYPLQLTSLTQLSNEAPAAVKQRSDVGFEHQVGHLCS